MDSRRTGLSPEAATLYAMAGPPSQDEHIVGFTSGPFDWHRLLWLAARERAVPIVWQRLKRLDVSVPEEVGQQFVRQAMVGDFMAERLEARLDEILDALIEAGVEPLVIKGAALATTVYPSFRLRPMGDLDLLVRPDQAATAHDVALRLRWDVIPEFASADYGRHHHLPPLADRSGAGSLELHTDLFVAHHPFTGFCQDMWRRSRPSEVRKGRYPDDVDTCLHICLHLAWSHVMTLGGWRALYDLATLVDQERLDWARVVADARTYHAASCCYWVFQLARSLAGVTIPQEVLDACRPPGNAVLQRGIQRHLEGMLDGPDRWCPSLAVSRWLWRLAIRPRWSGHGEHVPWEAGPTLPDGTPIGQAQTEQEAPTGLAVALAASRYLLTLAAPRTTR